MKRTTLRVATDVLMFFAMCLLAGTGLLIQYRLVPGFRGGHGLNLMGLTRHEWGTYHAWAAYFLLVLVFAHLCINFAFVKSVIARRRPWVLLALGLGGLAIVLTFLLAPIGESGPTHDGRGEGHRTTPERHAQ